MPTVGSKSIPDDGADQLVRIILGNFHTQELADFIRPHLEALVVESGTRTYGGFQLAGSFNVQAPEVLDFISNHPYKFANGIQYASTRAVRYTIQQAVKLGWDRATLAKALRMSIASEDRGDIVARTEYARASHKGSLAAFIQAGAVKKVWRCSPDCCGFCETLDGRVIDVRAVYALPGDEIEDARGELNPFKVSDYDSLDIALLHPHCRCDQEAIFEDDLEAAIGRGFTYQKDGCLHLRYKDFEAAKGSNDPTWPGKKEG